MLRLRRGLTIRHLTTGVVQLMMHIQCLEEMVQRDPRYAYEAYEFVFAALAHTLKRLGRAPEQPSEEPTEEEVPLDTGSLPAAVEALERKMIGAAIRKFGGNKTRAAEELKVSRRNLIRLVQKYELEK